MLVRAAQQPYSSLNPSRLEDTRHEKHNPQHYTLICWCSQLMQQLTTSYGRKKWVILWCWFTPIFVRIFPSPQSRWNFQQTISRYEQEKHIRIDILHILIMHNADKATVVGEFISSLVLSQKITTQPSHNPCHTQHFSRPKLIHDTCYEMRRCEWFNQQLMGWVLANIFSRPVAKTTLLQFYFCHSITVMIATITNEYWMCMPSDGSQWTSDLHAMLILCDTWNFLPRFIVCNTSLRVRPRWSSLSLQTSITSAQSMWGRLTKQPLGQPMIAREDDTGMDCTHTA